jgi:hypothetical protein
METVLYPFFYLTTSASEPAEEYITDNQLVFIIDGKTTLNATEGRCNFKQSDVFLLKNKPYISYVTNTLTRKGRFEAIKRSLTQDPHKEFFLHYKLEIN